ncbi:MAG TPA: ABC transporter permease [Candidatus Methylomirabilis sp.]|jgi:ABC-type nitrate/sulfonate/bicarbonate transport system permease component
MSDPETSPAPAAPAWERLLPPALFLAAGLVFWELAVRWFQIPRWLLPAPSQIAARFLKLKTLWYHTGLTLGEALAGFAASAVLGIALSAGIVHSRILERGVFPYVIVSNAIPIIAIIPLLTIWFGFGFAPKLMIAAIITFFPIVTNTTRGLKSADPRALDFMRSINATRWQVFSKVQFPTALPFIFAAFRIASSLSLVGAVVAEFYGSDRGLGFLVITSATQLQTDLLFVAIGVLAALGVGFFAFFGRLERSFGKWQVEPEWER